MFRWTVAIVVVVGFLAFVGTMPTRAADKEKEAAPLVVDKEKRTITMECKIAPRKIDDPKYQNMSWPIEVVACWPYPKGQKAHETVVTIDFKPSDLHKALEDLGLKPGKPVAVADAVPQGPEVNLFLEIPGADGQPKRVPLEKALIDPKTNKPMPKVKWRFTGSVMSQPDPTKDEKVYGADLTGTLISLFPVTDQTVFQTSLTLKEEKYLKLDTDKNLLPKEGTAIKLIVEVPPAK
jgi:hypothetical protein